LWDVNTKAAKLRIVKPKDKVCFVAFYPDGESLIVGHRRHIEVFDAKSGAVKFTLPDGRYGPIAFNWRENILTTDADGFFDATNGEPKECFVAGSGDHFVFSPDGTLYCVDGSLYDVGTGIKRVLGAWAYSWAFSHDSKLVANERAIWKVGADRPVWERRVDVDSFSDPTQVVFTPDDRFLLVSGRKSGEFVGLDVLDVGTGELLAELSPHPTVQGIALSPDASTLVTIGNPAGEPIRVWKVGLRPSRQPASN
jgi:WD40 repeat protein